MLAAPLAWGLCWARFVCLYFKAESLGLSAQADVEFSYDQEYEPRSKSVCRRPRSFSLPLAKLKC